ncbi:molybdenum cofactor guanylyltransferase [Halosegnis marinus]|uniref:Molybdenum cofactor guanylyltransferase n=1 Tax=Halosegnis marinus TaxID=3034023 RepID=A0ABD5ZSD5_9EURY|nr:molybdenum cofactor guanylyltransferase [Halosegnis sp. DT85]
MRAGAIVAGGRSTRFGDADKATAVLAGTPMIRRVADRLVGVTDALVVNCRPDQRAEVEAAMDGYPNPVTVAEDPETDEGPMAGIRTACRGAARLDAEYAFVAACDMPFLDPALADLCLERAAGRDAAVPRPDEWYATTHAAYRAGAMADACDRALARGDRKILAPLDDLDWTVVERAALEARGSLDSFESVDTREAFDRAAERLSR